MWVSILVGILVLVSVSILKTLSNAFTHSASDWYDRPMRGVDAWMKVRLHGTHDRVITVQTLDGKFTVRPINGLVHRVELVPLRQESVSMLMSSGSERTVLSGTLPLSKPAFGGKVRVDVSLIPPNPVWDMKEMMVTPLPRGGTLHTDGSFVGEDVLLVPGKGSPFVDKSLLRRFRRRNMRLHVVYYEDHTFARAKNRVDCSFASGSLQGSIDDIRHAFRITSARFCIGYSLGGLLVTTLLRQTPTFRLHGLVLLNPFLSMGGKQAPRWTVSPIGLRMLRALEPTFPTLAGQKVVPRRRPKFDWADYELYKYPLSVPNPIRADSTRRRVRCSFAFAILTLRAILDLKEERPKIETPVLLIGGTQDDVCEAKENIRVTSRLFQSVRMRTFSHTHYVLPGPDPDEDEELVETISTFFFVTHHDASVSRGD